MPFGHNAAFNAVLDMLQHQRPTAIACGNDVIAMGVLSAAHHLELAVPRELTVIGFDDIPMSSWPLVGLTTVHCDLEALASSAISLLTASMDGTSVGGQTVRIAPHTVLRTTHAPVGG